MSDTPENPGTPRERPADEVAHLDHSAADTGLHAPHADTSHRKKTPAPAAPAESLARPRGALVAMRKSGGLRFTWRLLVVHQDGRLIYKSNEIGAPEKARVIGTIDAAQKAALDAALAATTFEARAYGGRQNPDAFAYEIIARVGEDNHYAEAIQGSIPAALQPLITQLNALLPGAAPATPSGSDD
ncbi:hypothetical protein SE17_08775 [Kouleothrix aurantiaca]|uniref:Uncharacterized protein n=1 Tax=Kouleothrix aurantiaca TaxID=186479 RepID=A0A0P9HFP6_9CHLR|nr:hypothetical protein SE17_08775 [Kouleothrix aurantiaca]